MKKKHYTFVNSYMIVKRVEKKEKMEAALKRKNGKQH
jgi:hypothetical protein